MIIKALSHIGLFKLAILSRVWKRVMMRNFVAHGKLSVGTSDNERDIKKKNFKVLVVKCRWSDSQMFFHEL